MLYNFENKTILLVAVLFILGMNMISNIRKRAAFSLIATLFTLGSLYVHVQQRELLDGAYLFNMIIDMVFLGISMVNSIIIDEIETRRAVIKNVFENRYTKKSKKVSEKS